MPARVIGLIGVDTLEDIEYALTREAFAQMIAPFKKDFTAASRQFVSEMFHPGTDPDLREWILADISAAPPMVAMSAMTKMMEQYITGDAARIFEHIHAPVVLVNGDLWPINDAGNRRHMGDFRAIVIKNADHFLMMDRPEAFNPALEKAIRIIIEKANGEKQP